MVVGLETLGRILFNIFVKFWKRDVEFVCYMYRVGMEKEEILLSKEIVRKVYSVRLFDEFEDKLALHNIKKIGINWRKISEDIILFFL